MNGNGDAVKRKVKEWLRHADDDLRLARVAFKLKSAVPLSPHVIPEKAVVGCGRRPRYVSA
jgi:hypothetical protein